MTLPTIRANNGTFANLASVVIQPQLISSVVQAVQQQLSTLTHPNVAGVVPVRQAALPVQMVLHTPTAVSKLITANLTDIAEAITQAKPTNGIRKDVILPLVNRFNNIMPTFSLTLDGGRTYDPRTTQGFVETATKFQPYEQLTGIAQERPEIVMLTNFQPLFDRDASHTAPQFQNVMEEAGLSQFMTDAGKYIDAQFNIRNMRMFNVDSNLKMLRGRYANINQQLLTRSADFNQALNDLSTDASFLLNLVRLLESQKSQLDLRHDVYTVDPQDMANYVVSNFEQLHMSINPSDASSVLKMLSQVGNRKTYTCADTLFDFGYTTDNITNVFASTKIWMQLMIELRGIIQFHSLPFIDISPTYQKNDNNASTLLTPPVKYFTIAPTLPTLPTVDELVNLEVGLAATTITELIPAWSSIYQNVFFKTEEARIAALAHLVSREFRYSYGLTRPQVVASLGKFYGYNVVTTGNSTVFDSVIGRFGNNITDLPLPTDPSLASLASKQTTINNNPGQPVGVLNFETKYVEGDTGTLSPGGDYLFDQVLQTDGKSFNTTNMDALTAELDSQLAQLSIMVDGFNLMSLPSFPNPTSAGAATDTQDSFLNSPTDIVSSLIPQLINPKTGAALPVAISDRLGSVYSQARNDNRIKTILFLYTLNKISRSYATNVPFLGSNSQADNTPLVDYLITQLITALEASVPATRTAVQLVTVRGLDNNTNTDALTPASITSALKAGTPMTLMIEQFMSNVISQFKQQTSAIVGNYTRYNGYLDTIVMMAAFDFAISAVARYSNQQLVGTHYGLTPFSLGQVTFAVAQTATNHQASFNELTQRLSGEANLTREIIMTVLNVLRKFSGSLKGISNYLNSPQATNILNEISVTLDNPGLLNMLFNEQQIMLLASTVESLVTATAAAGKTKAGDTSDHNDGSSANQQITILDESDVPPGMKSALNGYFGQGDLASVEANNNCILTIGIPSGFTQRLKQKVSIQDQKKATFQTKQNDIVQVTIYKVDLSNSDIIYQPQRFMFEMSRFPTRYGTAQWLPLPDQPALADIINAIPTQCYSQNLDSSTSISITDGVEYASTAIADSEGIKGARAAFADPSYAFLTAAQKGAILNNHVVSMLLDSYIKLMTGINVAEYNYDMVAPPGPVETFFTKTLVEHTISHISEVVAAQNSSPPAQKAPAGGVLFSTAAPKKKETVATPFANKAQTHPVLSNPAGIAGKVSLAAQFRSVAASATFPVKTLEQQATVGDINKNLDAISQRNVSLVLTHLQTVTTLTQTWSSISDITALNKKVLSPKQFDRVFNILVDPRDFQIDVAQTNSTPWGEQALGLLIASGEVMPSQLDPATLRILISSGYQIQGGYLMLQGRSFPQNRAAPNLNGYVFRDRDKNQGDLVADKYFVTIETFGEGQV